MIGGLNWDDAARLRLGYIVVFFALGVGLPYLPVWLAHRGLTGEEVGLALAAAMAGRFIAGPIQGYLADATGRPRLVMTLAAGALTLAYLGLALPQPTASLIAVVFLSGMASAGLIPMLEAAAVRVSSRGGANYGPLRAIGSSAFVAATLLIGPVVEHWGPGAILAWLIFGAAIALVTAQFLPFAPAAPGERLDWSLAKVIFARPRLLAALGASALIQGAHAFYYGFSTLVWVDAGIAKVWIGLLWAVGVAGEILFLAVFAKRLERVDPALLLAAGAVAGLVRWTVLAFSPPIWATIAVQGLHAGTFAAAHLGFVLYARAHVEARAATTAQAVNSALTLGGVLSGATVLSGLLYQAHGALGYLLMSVLSALGLAAALGLWFGRRTAAVIPTATAAPAP